MPQITSGLLSSDYGWQYQARFWLPDADIIFSAPLTTTTRELFRVHRLKISLESVALREALSDISPNNSDVAAFDGLPLVHVMDSANDFTIFLTYLYYPEEAQVPPYNNTTCSLYEEYLRVATKYQSIRLLDEISTHLRYIWPSTLEDWDHRVRHYGAIVTDHIQTPNGDGTVDSQYLDDRLPEPVFAINLFRKYNLYKHLPTAFYDLSLITPTADWTTMHEEPHRSSERSRWLLKNRIRSARWSLLTPQDHMCLHRYFRRVQVMSLSTMPPNEDLCNTSACLQGRTYVQLKLLHEINHVRDILEVFNCYSQVEERQKMLQEGICSGCVTKISDFLRAKRAHIFDTLSHLFSLPSPHDDEL